MPSFLMVQERSYSSMIFFGRTTFLEHLKKMSYFHAFFLRKVIIFCLKNKIIFSGKRNIIFPNDTRKIIFHCNCFGKTIFSEHLEKIWKKNWWFSVQLFFSVVQFIPLRYESIVVVYHGNGFYHWLSVDRVVL